MHLDTLGRLRFMVKRNNIKGWGPMGDNLYSVILLDDREVLMTSEQVVAFNLGFASALHSRGVLNHTTISMLADDTMAGNRS